MNEELSWVKDTFSKGITKPFHHEPPSPNTRRSKMSIRVALLSNQPIVSFAITSVIKNYHDINVIIEDSLDNHEFFSNLIHFDVLLLAFDIDDRLRNQCQSLRGDYPNVKIIMLVDSEDDCYNQSLLEINADACIAKDEINESLIHIVRAVNAGKKMLSWSVAKKIVQEPQNISFDYASIGLTDGEWRMLQLMVKGSTNNQIADSLCLSPQTIRNKASHIYEKLGVDSRLALMKWAHGQGIVDEK